MRLTPGPNIIKTFFVRRLRIFVISQSVCPWQAFQAQTNLLVRPGAYPRVKHLKGASLGQAPALPANIRLGLKSLPGTNTSSLLIRNLLQKSFIRLPPGPNVIKLFLSVIYFHNKLECLSLASISSLANTNTLAHY